MNHSDMWGPDALARLGITFETGQEACLFADLLHDELERRVEQELLFTLPAEQMWALDNCKDGKEVLCWAEKNCPSYRTIRKNAGRQLKREVLANRRKIQGAVVAPWSAVWDRYTEELELSRNCYAALKRAGLNTIGDILAYGNLKWVRCLDRRGMTELTENLCRILPDQLIGEGGAARLQEDKVYDILQWILGERRCAG